MMMMMMVMMKIIMTNHVLGKKINAAKQLKLQTSDNCPSKNQPQQTRDFSTKVSTYENPSFVSNLSHRSGEFWIGEHLALDPKSATLT